MPESHSMFLQVNNASAPNAVTVAGVGLRLILDLAEDGPAAVVRDGPLDKVVPDRFDSEVIPPKGSPHNNIYLCGFAHLSVVRGLRE